MGARQQQGDSIPSTWESPGSEINKIERGELCWQWARLDMLSSALSSITGETEVQKNSQNQVGNHLRSCSSWVNGLGFIPALSPTTQGSNSADSCRFMGIFCFLPPAWAVIPDGLQAKAPEIWAPAPCQCSAVRTHHTDANNTEGTLAFDPGPAPGQSIPHCSAHFYSRINVQSLGCQRIY